VTSARNKTNYFIVEPEVAGSLGDETIIDSSVHPPNVEYLEYCFSDWLGDGILQMFPCFIVRKELQEELLKRRFSGINFQDMTVSKSELFYDLHEDDLELPEFVRLIVTGKKDIDDFWLAEHGFLVVSSAVLEVLKKHGLSNAEVKSLSVN
jgi:hypothetical protein